VEGVLRKVAAQTAQLVAFKDEYPGYKKDYRFGPQYSVSFIVPNEEVSVIKELLPDDPVDHIAGICSGGEIGLFCLAPLAKKKLVLVDHSYSQLACAAAKALLLKKHGVNKTRELFLKAIEDGPTWSKEWSWAKGALPEVLAEYLPDPLPVHKRSELVAHWAAYVTEEMLKKGLDSLHRVEFVHGDLTDLSKQKPADVLYISNALEHSGRNGNPNGKDVHKAVKPGGLIVGTRDRHFYDNDPRTCGETYGWTEIKTCRPAQRQERNYTMLWEYVVYRTPEK
jgi:hypothetical protein